METNPDQSLGNKEKLENQSKPQQSRDMEIDDPDQSKKLEYENSDWHPVQDKILDENKSRVQRDYKMSAEDLCEIRLETACWKELEEDEQDRCGTDRREFRKKISKLSKLKNCEIDWSDK